MSDPTVKIKQRVLILYPTATFFGGLLRIARALQESGQFDVIIYSHVRYPGWDDFAKQAEAVGVRMLTFMAEDKSIAPDLDQVIDALGFDPCQVADAPLPKARLSLRQRLQAGLLFGLWKRLLSKAEFKTLQDQYRRFERVHKAQIARAYTFIRRLDIDMLVLATE